MGSGAADVRRRGGGAGGGREKLQVVRRRRRPEDMRETADGRQVVGFFFPALLVWDEDVEGGEAGERGLQRVSD